MCRAWVDIKLHVRCNCGKRGNPKSHIRFQHRFPRTSPRAIRRLIQLIHENGKKAGVAICPATPVSALSEIIECADIILVMTVNPGWGGQKIIPFCVDKITQLKELRKEKNLNYLISCDGGINQDTVKDVLNAGVDVVVSGSSFFTGKLNWPL